MSKLRNVKGNNMLDSHVMASSFASSTFLGEWSNKDKAVVLISVEAS